MVLHDFEKQIYDIWVCSREGLELLVTLWSPDEQMDDWTDVDSSDYSQYKYPEALLDNPLIPKHSPSIILDSSYFEMSSDKKG